MDPVVKILKQTRSEVGSSINDYHYEHGHTPKGVIEDIIIQIVSDKKSRHKLNIGEEKQLKTKLYKEFYY